MKIHPTAGKKDFGLDLQVQNYVIKLQHCPLDFVFVMFFE